MLTVISVLLVAMLVAIPFIALVHEINKAYKRAEIRSKEAHEYLLDSKQ
jgi:hypothetical protein